jgi:hypothetical protein
MLNVLPFVLVLAGAPAPDSPTPSPGPPTKLQEIGRVRTSICTAIVVHANGAITQALDNDRTLAILTTNLRTVDFDNKNFLQRRNAIDALMKQTQVIRENFRGADVEIKQLRQYALNSNDPQRKVELKTFADALGGALQRQKRAAEEFDRDITIIRGRQDALEAHQIEQRDARLATAGLIPSAVLDRMDAVRAPAQAPRPPVEGEWNQTMQQIAAAVNDRLPAIAADEGKAADHSIAATTGC